MSGWAERRPIPPRGRRLVALRAAIALLALLAIALLADPVGAERGAPSARAEHAAAADPGRLVGQRLVVAMTGTFPGPDLLARVRAGEVGGVVLFGWNVRGPAQLRALTDALRAAARAGGQPGPLVAVDQEGGAVRRLPWAPPTPSARGLGRLSPEAVRAQGRAAGQALRAAGIDVDLAPVADVPGVSDSFIAARGRAFSSDPLRVSVLALAFARGLEDAGVVAVAKHFPGLGRASTTTDVASVTVGATRAQLDSDLAPFRALVAGGVPMVMLSNAVYTAYGSKPAAWSPAIQLVLRRELGFGGVTITDSLDAAAATHGRSLGSAAVLAAQAGTDLLLVTGSEADSAAVYRRLVAAARARRIPRASLERSYARILALKRRLDG